MTSEMCYFVLCYFGYEFRQRIKFYQFSLITSYLLYFLIFFKKYILPKGESLDILFGQEFETISLAIHLLAKHLYSKLFIVYEKM